MVIVWEGVYWAITQARRLATLGYIPIFRMEIVECFAMPSLKLF